MNGIRRGAAALLTVLLLTTTVLAAAADVPKSSWAYEPVSYVLDQGIMETDAQGNFRIQEEISRGEFVYSIWCAAGRPASSGTSFSDVASGSRYYQAVSWAEKNNVASGTSATTFSPNNTMTREQAFTFLWKALPVLGLEREKGAAISVFYDSKSVSSWALPAIKSLYAQGIVTGTNENNLEPKRTVKRGEAGEPGELKGSFSLAEDRGTLYANTECGVFGTMAPSAITGRQAVPVAQPEEVETGPATILSNIRGDAVEEFAVEIVELRSRTSDTQNLVVEVTDPRLLEETGGIVQGMSGSPILQNGKLVGAVTHVMVDDPARGYGIFVTHMLEQVYAASDLCPA